uniref:uridylate kinase-like n=1 Tax=Erigeron canadensis TaxID=72917 RepID=UPI001CB9B743|nr:uridylate kinase-like [Erigeron canadensis]
MASPTNTEKSSPINNGNNSDDNQITVHTPATIVSVEPPEEPRSKKSKHDSSGGDYRREREEWNDKSVEILLDAFTEKYMALNKSLLLRKDWQVVSEVVNDKCGNKSMDQCKNKIDNLKRRYKLEVHRVNSNSGSISTWKWFKKMDLLFGNSPVAKSGGENVLELEGEGKGDEDEGDDRSVGVSSGNQHRRSARLASPHNSPVPNNVKRSTKVKWKRVVFKVSGTALTGSSQNIDPKVALQIAEEVAIASRSGVQVAIIIGGRNFFCGDSWVSATDLDRPTAYQIGMMATVMNSILLQSALEKLGIQTRVQSAFVMPEVAEPYNRLRAMRHLDKGRVVIFGGVGAGTGNPLFTTDTAAALRATEIDADAVIKGTSVNGMCDKNNVTLDKVNYRYAVSRGCPSIDLMAIQFCQENAIPVVIFNMLKPGNVSKALTGEQVGTLIEQ